MPKMIWPMPVTGNPMGIWGIAKEFGTVAEAQAWVREYRLDTTGMLLVSGGMVYVPTEEGFASAAQFEAGRGATGYTGPLASGLGTPRKPHLDGTW
jgi:hypothetical protein